MTVISGGSVFPRMTVGASDLPTSVKFYDAGLGALGVKNLGPFGETIVLYGKDMPALLVMRPGNGEAPSSNGVTVGFAAWSTAGVDAFHAADLANGGSCDGERGPRGHPPGAYAAYLRDSARDKACSYTFVEA